MCHLGVLNMARCIDFQKTEETHDTVTYRIDDTDIKCTFNKITREILNEVDYSDWRVCALCTKVISFTDNNFKAICNWSS